MVGRADRLDRLDEAPADRALADQDRRDRPAPTGIGMRDALLRRLADLPPGHPSSTRADRARERTDRSDRNRQPDGTLDREDDAPGDSFWAQVPRFEALWQSHLRRWPDRRDQARDTDRLEDPPGSWRGDGGQYLNPDHNARADRLITELRQPEKEVTKLLKDIEQVNPHGGVLAGLDHRLKGAARLKEKIVDKADGDLGASMADLVCEINDAVRYTYCFGSEEYARGFGDIRQRLETSGCQMIYARNRWLDDPEYKGINTCWQTPDGGRFELQFHTQESYYAKENLTHRSYRRVRAPDSSRAELRALHSYQRLVSSTIEEPARVLDIANTRKKPHD